MCTKIFLSSGLFALLVVGCQAPAAEESTSRLRIVCTTGMIADAVANVVGPDVMVTALMGPGVDPHLYKASQGDLQQLSQADLIFYNGLHLEGKMVEILEKIGSTKSVIAVSDGISRDRILKLTHLGDTNDPHIWFDVSIWADVVAYIGANLEKLDTLHAADYAQRTAAYRDSLHQLHEWVRQELSTVPPAQRVLITAHDAFSYFGKAYEVEVRGLQGISTVSEYGLKDVSDLVEFISGRKINAVFVETSVPAKPLEAVVEGCAQRGHEVVIGGTLYSDAMGQAGTPEGDYLGMVRANVRTIVNALKGIDHANVSH
ncbi:MAG: zinc ABC transporter substrate-binding protein [Saprospirales bacterium]|nr:zinc ABC transporter substrate-binding protein [Saprospirales bacterium]